MVDRKLYTAGNKSSKRMNKEEVLKKVKEEDIETIRFVYVNANGLISNKSWNVKYFEDAVEEGVKIFPGNYFLAYSYGIPPNSKFKISSSDIYLKPDLDTFTVLPFSSKTARVMGYFYERDGRPWECDSRGILRKTIERCNVNGFKIVSAGELEFYLLRVENGVPKLMFEPEQSLPYTTYAHHVVEPLLQDFTSHLWKMGTHVTRIVREGGPSQYELNIKQKEGVSAADDIVSLREAIRSISFNHGLCATFMPRPFQEHLGNGMHIHQSLYDTTTGKNVFIDPEDKRNYGLSETCYHYIGGILEHAKALTAICAPTANSYKRLVPGTVSVDAIAYGPENRGAAIRIPSERNEIGTESARIEFRIPDPAANPYLVLACIVACGLQGIDEKIDPGNPMTNNKIVTGKKNLLPRSLAEAIDALKRDKIIRSAIGEQLFSEFIKLKEYEWDLYSSNVTPWERRTYLEAF